MREKHPSVGATDAAGREFLSRRPAELSDEELVTAHLAGGEGAFQELFHRYRDRPRLQHLVEDTIEKLPDHHRLVFRMRELEGRSYKEISEITGLNLGTVESRLHRARSSFAQRIKHLLN